MLCQVRTTTCAALLVFGAFPSLCPAQSENQPLLIPTEEPAATPAYMYLDLVEREEELFLEDIYEEIPGVSKWSETLYESQDYQAVEAEIARRFDDVAKMGGARGYAELISELVRVDYRYSVDRRASVIESWVEENPDSYVPKLIYAGVLMHHWITVDVFARDNGSDEWTGEHTKATFEPIIENLRNADSEDPMVSLFLLMRATYTRDDSAYDYYRATLHRSHHFPQARKLYGQYLINVGRLDDADTFVQRTLDRTNIIPDSAHEAMWTALGLSFQSHDGYYLERPVFDRCYQALLKRADVDPSDPSRHVVAAWFCAQRGEYTKAREHFEIVGDRIFDNGGLEIELFHEARVQTYVELARATSDESERTLLIREALRLSPIDYEAVLIAGYQCIAQQRFGEGEKLLLRSIELNPNFAQHYLLLIQFYIYQGRIEEASELAAQVQRRAELSQRERKFLDGYLKQIEDASG